MRARARLLHCRCTPTPFLSRPPADFISFTYILFNFAVGAGGGHGRSCLGLPAGAFCSCCTQPVM